MACLLRCTHRDEFCYAQWEKFNFVLPFTLSTQLVQESYLSRMTTRRNLKISHIGESFVLHFRGLEHHCTSRCFTYDIPNHNFTVGELQLKHAPCDMAPTSNSETDQAHIPILHEDIQSRQAPIVNFLLNPTACRFLSQGNKDT